MYVPYGVPGLESARITTQGELTATRRLSNLGAGGCGCFRCGLLFHCTLSLTCYRFAAVAGAAAAAAAAANAANAATLIGHYGRNIVRQKRERKLSFAGALAEGVPQDVVLRKGQAGRGRAQRVVGVANES
jgi:hypothetical protein